MLKQQEFFVTLVSFLLLLNIGLAGALGSVARYLGSRLLIQHVHTIFPLATLLINVLGAFLIGLVFALTAHSFLTPTLQLIFATGFLGGFTTFSTMSWEGFQLARGGKVTLSFLYFAGSFALGLLAEMLGMLLGGWR